MPSAVSGITYVVLVAFAMSEQLPDEAVVHRCHWYSYSIVCGAAPGAGVGRQDLAGLHVPPTVGGAVLIAGWKVSA